jgi:hypothetical protein
MSAKKLDSAKAFEALHAHNARLTLPSNAVRIRKNGIEFRTPNPIPPWTELSVDLQSPADARKMHFNGVVVACTGSRHAGYCVSLLFTNVSRQSQARLNSLSLS